MAGLGRVIGVVGGSPEIPEHTYTGDYLYRIVYYSGTMYAELELITSGTLSFVESEEIDLYLVSGGGGINANPVNASIRTSGGGSGSAAALLGIQLSAGEAVSMVVGAGQGTSSVVRSGVTILSAQPGGQGWYNGSGVTPGGAGYSDYYDLYGDPLYRRGQGSPGSAGGAMTGTVGKGGDGCKITALKAGVNGGGYTTPSAGYGAGANGGTTFNSNSPGAQGVVLVRIALL